MFDPNGLRSVKRMILMFATSVWRGFKTSYPMFILTLPLLFSYSLIIHKENVQKKEIRWKTGHFASLISTSKIIFLKKQYQAFHIVFHHQMNYLEVRQKYSAACRIFNSLLSVSSSDETVRLMLDILLLKFKIHT